MSRSLGSITQPVSQVPGGVVIYEGVVEVSNLEDTLINTLSPLGGIGQRFSIFLQVQGTASGVVFSVTETTSGGGIKLKAGDPGGDLYDNDSTGACSVRALDAPVNVYIRIVGEAPGAPVIP